MTAVVVIDPFPYIGLGEASAFGLQAYLAEAQAMAGQSLDLARQIADAAGVPFTADTIERSAVFEGILDTATSEGCDLIVMGSHGRSGVKALILGSGVAIEMATHRQLKGVMLGAPYTSITEMAKRDYPWMPIELFIEPLTGLTIPIYLKNKNECV